MTGKMLQLSNQVIELLNKNPNQIVHTNSEILLEILKHKFPTVKVYLYKVNPKRKQEDIFWNFANGESLWMFGNKTKDRE